MSNEQVGIPDKLKPCPFCGGEAFSYKVGLHRTICCKSDKCSCAITRFNEREDVLIKAWNTRTEPDLSTIEAVDSAIDAKYAEIEKLMEMWRNRKVKE